MSKPTRLRRKSPLRFVIILLLGQSFIMAACGDVTPTTGSPLVTNTAQAVAKMNTPTSVNIFTATPTTRSTNTAAPTLTPQLQTATPPVTNGSKAKGTLSQIFPALANLPTAATSMRLQNDYSSIGPSYTSHYLLERQSDGFVGEANFKQGYGTSTAPLTTLTVNIPANVAQDFLQSVIQIPMTEGQYTPFMSHTDDYPIIGYQIDTPAGTVSFYTKSQNDLGTDTQPNTTNNVPWSCYFAKRTFVINSPLASQALAKLKPYLYTEVIEGFSKQASNPQPNPQPTALPTPPDSPTPAPLTQGTLMQFSPYLATQPDSTNLRFNYSWYDSVTQQYAYSEYYLAQHSKQFEGEGIFEDGVTSKKISIPANAVHNFWQNLLQIKLERVAKTTDYTAVPTFELNLTIGIHTLRISAYSSNHLTPVKIDYDGQIFVAKSNAPFQTFAIIRAYLDEATMKDFANLPPNYNGPLFSYP